MNNLKLCNSSTPELHNSYRIMKKILVIAASDSGGGAGIQADVKAITLCGGFAMTAITALTAQNTQTVKAVFPIPVEFIEQQIDAVMQDIGADAVKTGMLFTAAIVRSVARKIKDYGIAAAVVDPVMKAKGGATLLQEPAIEAVITDLFPLALVVTPNLDEASLLCGFSIDSIETMKAAAKKIKAMGPHHVVVKGGHLAGDCIDLFYDGSTFTEFASPRIATTNTHGTGCTFASAVATEIAQGFSPLEAVQRAKAVHSGSNQPFLLSGKRPWTDRPLCPYCTQLPGSGKALRQLAGCFS